MGGGKNGGGGRGGGGFFGMAKANVTSVDQKAKDKVGVDLMGLVCCAWHGRCFGPVSCAGQGCKSVSWTYQVPATGNVAYTRQRGLIHALDPGTVHAVSSHLASNGQMACSLPAHSHALTFSVTHPLTHSLTGSQIVCLAVWLS